MVLVVFVDEFDYFWGVELRDFFGVRGFGLRGGDVFEVGVGYFDEVFDVGDGGVFY